MSTSPTMWLKSSLRIAKFRCLRHRITGEITLIGRYGEIFPDGENYGACAYNHKVANKLCKFLGKDRGYKTGDECQIHFGAELLEPILKQIKPYKQTERQLMQLVKWGFVKNTPKNAKKTCRNSKIKYKPEPVINNSFQTEKAHQTRGVEAPNFNPCLSETDNRS